jgi:hypothetical protein
LVAAAGYDYKLMTKIKILALGLLAAWSLGANQAAVSAPLERNPARTHPLQDMREANRLIV